MTAKKLSLRFTKGPTREIILSAMDVADLMQTLRRVTGLTAEIVIEERKVDMCFFIEGKNSLESPAMFAFFRFIVHFNANIKSTAKRSLGENAKVIDGLSITIHDSSEDAKAVLTASAEMTSARILDERLIASPEATLRFNKELMLKNYTLPVMLDDEPVPAIHAVMCYLFSMAEAAEQNADATMEMKTYMALLKRIVGQYLKYAKNIMPIPPLQQIAMTNQSIEFRER